MNRSTPGLPVITNSRSSLRLMYIESVMPSSHLILCRPLLLPPTIPPSIRVFSNESTLRMRWPKYWSFSFCIIGMQGISVCWFYILQLYYIHWLALVIFWWSLRVFYVEDHVICKQWEFYFFFSNLDSFSFFFCSDCCGKNFQSYVE